ncbi:MAG: glycosyltransferase family 4 protein [Planctomycetes bacterium]|nr:glycosyltransferase family 4 protein [Planctomycetota bacterium]
MRILHLFSDWKWTGPAEPALDLVAAQREIGLDVTLACTPLPFEARDTIEAHARRRGIEIRTDLALRKHYHPWHNWRDRGRLRTILKREKFNVVHCHRLQDHWVAAAAMRGLPPTHRPILVRTCYDGVPQIPHWRNRRLYAGVTDWLIHASEAACKEDARNFPLAGRASVIPAPLDTRRWRPDRTDLPDLRGSLGLSRDHVVFGIVARIQGKRRFDLLWEAFVRASREVPQARLVVIGRGTRQREVAEEPLRKMGLTDRVILAGYRVEDYDAALATLDAKIYLVPGTDGTCRALRQAMAMGKPAIGTRRGMIPQIVTDGTDGILVDETPDALAGAIARLANDIDLRARMGIVAAAKARSEWDAMAVARKVADGYSRRADGVK